MDNSILVAIVTSAVALIVALISGVFSYLSTMRTTKVEKLKAYVDFMRHKMDKLENLQTLYQNANGKKEESLTGSMTNILVERFPVASKYLTTYKYLITIKKDDYGVLCELRDRLDLSIKAKKFAGTAEVKDEFKNELIVDSNELIAETVKFVVGFEKLINGELEATYLKFEALSTE